MGAFTLFADEAEELDGTGAGGPEPMRRAGVELGDLSCVEDEVVLAEDQAESAVEDVNPVVALMRAQVRFLVVAADGEDELVRLDAAGPAGQGDDRRSVTAANGAQVDAGVPGGRRVDEFVEGDAVGTGQREQLFERGASQTRFEPRQRAGRDAGLFGEVGEGDVAVCPQALEPRPDRVEGAVQVVVNAASLPFGKMLCTLA
jgi:hypothetical protein